MTRPDPLLTMPLMPFSAPYDDALDAPIAHLALDADIVLDLARLHRVVATSVHRAAFGDRGDPAVDVWALSADALASDVIAVEGILSGRTDAEIQAESFAAAIKRGTVPAGAEPMGGAHSPSWCAFRAVVRNAVETAARWIVANDGGTQWKRDGEMRPAPGN